jgi:hypothetical protein
LRYIQSILLKGKGKKNQLRVYQKYTQKGVHQIWHRGSYECAKASQAKFTKQTIF